jgi:hypothetical protein
MAFFVISVIVFLVTYVDKRSIKIDGNELILKVKDEYILGSLISKDADEQYEYTQVEKYTFKTPSGTTIFYERVTIDADRIFNNDTLSNVRYIFDAKDAEIIQRDADMLMMQLKLQDNSYINLIAESSNDDTLNIVYGFTNDEFTKLITQLYKDKNKIEELKHKVDALNDFKSRWFDEKLLIEELSMSVTE